MKLYCVEYPFDVEGEPEPDGGADASVVSYPSMRAAISAAKDHYQVRDEAEDEMSADRQDVFPLSRKPAVVLAIELELVKDLMCDLLNGVSLNKLLDGNPSKKVVAAMKYRKGKIVVMGAAEEKESE